MKAGEIKIIQLNFIIEYPNKLYSWRTKGDGSDDTLNILYGMANGIIYEPGNSL